MPRAEQLAHSLGMQLVENCHAIEQAIANHRWVELSRLYLVNADIGTKLVEALVELDPGAAEHISAELRKYEAKIKESTQTAAPEVTSAPAGAVVAQAAEGSVGVIKGKKKGGL